MSHSAPQPVVVAFDGVGSHAALAFAAREADIIGTPLQLVHVMDPETDVAALHRGPVETAAAAVAELTCGRVKVETLLREGEVPATLTEVSRTASLLVVEHRRVSRLRRHRTPSIAGQVAGRVHSRVVSVPEDWAPGPKGGGCIMLGLDAIDQEADILMTRAFARASRERARLRLVHAWSMATPYDDSLVDPRVEGEWIANYQRMLGQRLKALRLEHRGVDVEMVVVHRAPSQTLIELSTEADLLLLGRGRSVHPLVNGLGSVPRAVLEDARCPVEVVSTS